MRQQRISAGKQDIDSSPRSGRRARQRCHRSHRSLTAVQSLVTFNQPRLETAPSVSSLTGPSRSCLRVCTNNNFHISPVRRVAVGLYLDFRGHARPKPCRAAYLAYTLRLVAWALCLLGLATGCYKLSNTVWNLARGHIAIALRRLAIAYKTSGRLPSRFLHAHIQMLEVATGTSRDGGGRRRLPTVDAGEVTKQKGKAAKKDAPDTTEPPPLTSDRIGGARNIFQRYTATSNVVATNDTSEGDTGLNDVVALQGPSTNPDSKAVSQRKVHSETSRNPTAKSRGSGTNLPRPSIAQQEATYEDLAEIRRKETYHSTAATVQGKERPDQPFWEANRPLTTPDDRDIINTRSATPPTNSSALARCPPTMSFKPSPRMDPIRSVTPRWDEDTMYTTTARRSPSIQSERSYDGSSGSRPVAPQNSTALHITTELLRSQRLYHKTGGQLNGSAWEYRPFFSNKLSNAPQYSLVGTPCEGALADKPTSSSNVDPGADEDDDEDDDEENDEDDGDEDDDGGDEDGEYDDDSDDV